MAKKVERTRRSFGGLRQLPSGRWQANYTGPDTVLYKHAGTFDAQDDAIAWLAAERRKIDLGTWTPPGTEPKAQRGLSIRTYCETWHAQTAGRHKPRTRALNLGYLNNVILPELGDVRLTALTVQDVREWFAGLSNYPTRNSNAYSLLRTILNEAVEDNLIDVNPCRVKRAAVKHRVVEPIALDASEIRQLAAVMPRQWKALVLLAGFSGLRWGELSALRRADLNMVDLEVTVNRAVVRTGGVFVVSRPKSKAALRTVPLPEGLRTALVEHLSNYAAPGRDGLIFPAKSGDVLNRDTVKESFAKAATAIGYPKLRIHDLRHSAATLFAQAGATLADHMTLLGHTSSAMSARYTHSTASRTRGLVQALWSE